MAEITTPQSQEHTAAAEIQELERLLQEKKQALAEKGVTHDEKETFRQVFKEKYTEPPTSIPVLSGGMVPIQPTPAMDNVSGTDGDLKKKQREAQLRTLIDLSFEKGVMEAVTLARAMTPWLLDELHDRLADEDYAKIMQKK